MEGISNAPSADQSIAAQACRVLDKVEMLWVEDGLWAVWAYDAHPGATTLQVCCGQGSAAANEAMRQRGADILQAAGWRVERHMPPQGPAPADYAEPYIVAWPPLETVVVTRHPGLLSYLQAEGITSGDVPVISHATAADVTGKHVIGVLPHHLSCLAARVTEIPLNLPAELRGVELSEDQVRQYAGPPATYEVRRIG